MIARWVSWLSDKEAPVEWLYDIGFIGMNNKEAFGFCGYLSWLACAMIARKNMCAAALFFTVAACYAICPFVLRCGMGRFSRQSDVPEMALAILYTFSCCFCVWSLLDVSDPVFRHRSMGIVFIFSKTSIMMFGFRFVTSFFMLIVIGINDVVATWIITVRFGENTDLVFRLPGLILVISTVHLIGIYHQQLRWRMLYDSQVCLTAEKTAMESLLSMVCDSVFWLSASGTRVSRSSPQFDSMVGQAMLNEDIAHMISEEECLNFLMRRAVPGTSPVVLFHTSLVLSPSQAVKVELFVVDRRSSNQSGKNQEPRKTFSPSDAMGFLVGLRLCEPFEMQPLERSVQDSALIGSTTSTVASQEVLHPRGTRKAEVSGKEHDATPVSSAGLATIATSSSSGAATGSGSPQDARQSNIRQTRVAFDIPLSTSVPEALDSVSVTSSRVSSRSSGTKGILRRREKQVVGLVDELAHDGPVHGQPYAESDTYLRQCSQSLVEDLVSSWNFKVQGCCAWHASLRHLNGLIDSMKTLHQCREKWRPEVLWQCQHCTALHGPNHPAESCWLCYEPCEPSDAEDVLVSTLSSDS